MNLVTETDPPIKRSKKCDGPKERFLKEPAVMLIMTQWMLNSGCDRIEIHPDGQHLKQFNMRSWLIEQGFQLVESIGKTDQGGRYQSDAIIVELIPKSGLGDVVGVLNGERIEIEAKGGCINSKHAGQLSKLRKGLTEAVGQLMSPHPKSTRLIAAVPYHEETKRLAHRMAYRCKLAGIEIALTKEDGTIHWIEE